MGLKLIWAEDRWGGIGVNNQLPWHIKEDLIFFKKKTADGVIIMGYNTWLSLPFKPLSGRKNIILSRKAEITDFPETVRVFRNFAEAVEGYPDAWVIGGASLYKEALPIAEELYITEVDTDINFPDVFAPDRNLIEQYFERVYRSEQKFDVVSGLKFTFNRFERKL